ncbi:MAG: PDZ domain-containing protein [Alphaproteobacteria bacterium]|nr:PDZ domain-containing protein [Alphaproteobacteria bacterium]
MRRILFGLTLFCFFALSFPLKAQEIPVWWEPVLGYAQLPIGRMFDTLHAACKIITEKSLTPVSANTFAFSAVKSLSTIDQKISALMDGKRVLILADGKILKSFRAPEDNDCANWSRLVLAAAVEVRPYSPKAQKADAEELFNILINAALGNIDSYSHYAGADPAELEPLNKPAGLGISYRRIGRYLDITEILPDGAASRTDLAVGDRISAINGKTIADLSRVQILNLLRGEEGTEVVLDLRKDGKAQTRTITRAPASASSVTYFFDDKDKLMTIKISAFTEKTLIGLNATLNKAQKMNAAGLIIDLRANTGGLLKQAVLAADMFLPQDLLIIKTKGRHPDTQHQYTSTSKDRRPVYPIAVLIDRQTASSAEFFAGILQEYRHAVVIGTPSYGKSVIQANDTLPDGGEIYLTWAQYYLPSGYSPQGYGIYPNLCTSGKTLLDIDHLPAPKTNMQPWRKGTEQEKKKGLSLCPPQSRKDNPLDTEAARMLLLDQERYERALTYFSLDSTEK